MYYKTLRLRRAAATILIIVGTAAPHQCPHPAIPSSTSVAFFVTLRFSNLVPYVAILKTIHIKKKIKLQKKIEEISRKIWINNINEILVKFWIKLRNLDWIIPNTIFIQFKFVEHLRKILKTLDCFLVRFELISSRRKITKFRK